MAIQSNLDIDRTMAKFTRQCERANDWLSKAIESINTEASEPNIETNHRIRQQTINPEAHGHTIGKRN